jgi:large subunit ribosomal protein L22
MGRAYRYQRRIAHMEVVLAEKGAQNGAGLATVVGEEEAAAPAKAPAKKKAKAAGAKKKPAKKTAARK